MVDRGNARGVAGRERASFRGQRGGGRWIINTSNRTSHRVEKGQRKRLRGGLQKTAPSSVGLASVTRDVASSEADENAQRPRTLPGLVKLQDVVRTKSSLSSCSELSLAFVGMANLDTDEDTNTIALNLMDYFLFSEENWLPELSYCHLHAACFIMASLITGKSNTPERVAASLGRTSEFVRLMASPLAEDDDSLEAIGNIIGIDTPDVDSGYGLLYERRYELVSLMGVYAESVAYLPSSVSTGVNEESEEEAGEEIDFDVVEA